MAFVLRQTNTHLGAAKNVILEGIVKMPPAKHLISMILIKQPTINHCNDSLL